MKNNDHDLNKPLPVKGYKKRYLVRQIETEEAEKELKNYDPMQDAYLDDMQDIQLPKVD